MSALLKPTLHAHDERYKALDSTSSNNEAEDSFSDLERGYRSLPVLNVDWSVEKYVDGPAQKMRDTSNPDRKRKHHRDSSDLNSSITIGGSISPQLRGETVPTASPFNSEIEGVVTRYKRVKHSAKDAGKHWHSSVLTPEPLSGLHPLGKWKIVPKSRTSKSVLPNVDFNGVARDHKISVSSKRAAANEGSPDLDFLAFYKGPPTHLPDYGPAVCPDSVPIVPGRNNMAGGERKLTGFLGGSFKPQNTLHRSNGSPSLAPRPGTKVFDLHEGASDTQPNEEHTAKRRKLGAEMARRNDSSNSFIDLSGEGSRTGTAASLSSIGSAPVKSARAVNQRSQYPAASLDTFGNVDAYRKLEATVGFGSDKTSKGRRVEQRITSSYDEARSSSGIFSSTTKKGSRLVATAEKSTRNVRGAKNQTLVHDTEIDEIEEVKPGAKRYQGVAKKNSSRNDASASMFDEKGDEKRDLGTSEDSPYFADSAKRYKTEHGELLASATLPHEIDLKDSISLPGSSPDILQSSGSALDDVLSLEDSVDLLKTDSDLVKEDQDEVKVIFHQDIGKHFSAHESESIYVKGDIPPSSVGKAKPKTTRAMTRRSLSSETSFDFTHLISGQSQLCIQDGCVPWQLHYNERNGHFDIIAYGESLSERYPGLILKPEKIHRVYFSAEYGKVFITKAKEADTNSAANFLLQTHEPRDGSRFAEYLRTLRSTITLCPNQSVYIGKVFAKSVSQNFLGKSTRLTENKPDDISLYEAREKRRINTQEEMQGGNSRMKTSASKGKVQAANIGRRRGITVEDDTSANQARKQTVVRKMMTQSKVETPLSTPAVSDNRGENEASSTSPQISGAVTSELNTHRPITRATRGKQEDEQTSYSERQRLPSPPQWTRDHPRWAEEVGWKASLVFPAEAKKQATIDLKDIERLDEGAFLNDNLIEFYLRYLEDCLEKVRPELAKRIYFQNTFFYLTLTKGKLRKNNINYEAVKRWTKVDIFSYDYIVVPVCENLHWYVAIICNAPKLLRLDTAEDETPWVTDDQATSHYSKQPKRPLVNGLEEAAASKAPDINVEPGAPGQLTDLAERRSASPSVIAQVELMSLEDTTGDWPESDAMPKHLATGISRLGASSINRKRDGDFMKGDFRDTTNLADDGQSKKKQKRKSMPTARKYDPNGPRIITLDSLGGSHSPTCSNLLEYLVCEAKTRHGVEIIARRLGMTAKGLPQQSNFCDCGVFVLGYIEKFLKDPDAFVQQILQGEMAADKDWDDMNAPIMRQSIRELIFELYAEQTRPETEQRNSKSKKKSTKKDSQANAPSAHYIGVPESNSTSLSREMTPLDSYKAATDSSVSRQPAITIADDGEESMSPETPHARESPTLGDLDEETGLFPVGDSAPRDRYPTNTSILKIGAAQSSSPDLEELEIVETTATETASARVRVGSEPASSVSSSPRSVARLREPSIEQGSPFESVKPKMGLLGSPFFKTSEETSNTNVFKKFAKLSTSPRQSPRHKNRENGESATNPWEIKDSYDGPSEIGETPERDLEPQSSFEDLSKLPDELAESTPFNNARGSTSSPVTASRFSPRSTRRSPRASRSLQSSPLAWKRVTRERA